MQHTPEWVLQLRISTVDKSHITTKMHPNHAQENLQKSESFHRIRQNKILFLLVGDTRCHRFHLYASLIVCTIANKVNKTELG